MTGSHKPPLDRNLEATITGSPAVITGHGSRPQPPSIADGTRIVQYEIIRELGRGGMGSVYLARDTRLGRRVAIKLLSADAGAGSERFLAEARATARCVHENIVEIHEVNEHQGMPFMVLEYLGGQPLSALLTGAPLPAARAVELMVPVVRALACAHAQGIVHRDLKPDNIIITESGTVKVLDFGIAKLLAPDDEPASPAPYRSDGTLSFTTTDLTRRSSGVGTVPYMSPEQWGADDIDHRSDLWAVGIILYTMVTGKHPLAPFRAERLASTAALDVPMPRVADAGQPGGVASNIPGELAQLIDHCLRKRKAERIASATELLAGLEPLLPGRAPRRGDHHSPYAGLTAFQEADADRFFGRARDIAAMVARLRDQPLLAVVGPSGAGKSSFVRAGVIPALKRSGQSWDALVMRPGRHPLAALAHMLLPLTLQDGSEPAQDHGDAGERELRARLENEPGTLGAVLRERARARSQRVVLFVDQFEELYTLVADAAERDAYLACLLGMADDAAAPLRVIVSIRSDFLDRVAGHRRFMTELTRGIGFLPAPDRAGLRDALVQPAELAGYSFSSDDMIEHMLDALEGTPGALPLLQFTAGVLWDMRDSKRRQLTGASYAQIGGVAGALAGHADAVLHALPSGQQRLARALFRRLVTPERTRDIAELDELRTLSPDAAEVDQVVGYFVAARLLVVHQGEDTSSPQVEIVHESLITRWPALRRWLDENQEAALFLSELRTAARQWRARERSPGLLWRGDAAQRARRLLDMCAGEIADGERDYLDAVFALADRSARLRRRAIIGVMAFLTTLVVAAAVALIMIRNAEESARDEAERAHQAERQARQAEQRMREQNQIIKANEQRIREQLAALEAERQATAAAEKRAEEASNVTAMTRQELIEALQRAESESRRARQEAERARRAGEQAEKAAAAEKAAGARLQRLLDERERRIKKLERELGGISDGPLR